MLSYGQHRNTWLKHNQCIPCCQIYSKYRRLIHNRAFKFEWNILNLLYQITEIRRSTYLLFMFTFRHHHYKASLRVCYRTSVKINYVCIFGCCWRWQMYTCDWTFAIYCLKKKKKKTISVCPAHSAANSRGLWLNWVRPRYECGCMNLRRLVVQEHACTADSTGKSS